MVTSKDSSRPSSTSEKSEKFKTGDRKAATDATDFLDAKQKQKRQKDLERLGLFSDIGYLQPNVYVPKDKDLFLFERTKGPQMLTVPPKKGHFDKEAFFNKDFIHIFEKDAYCDYILLRRKFRQSQSAKNIGGHAFLPTSGDQKPSGKGSLFGTFGYRFPMGGEPEEEFDLESEKNSRRAQTAQAVEHLKNFVTAPSKKGTGYGYVDVTIGQPFPYKPSPFDSQKELEQKERQRNKSLCISKRPFISSSRPIEVFDPKIYSAPPSAAGQKTTKGTGSRTNPFRRVDSGEQRHLPPFRPTNPAKSGIFGTFDAYPKAIPVGSDDELHRHSLQSAPATPQVQTDEAGRQRNIFRPSGGSHSFPIRSIALMNVPKVPIMFKDSTGKFVRANSMRQNSMATLRASLEKRKTSKESLAFALPVEGLSAVGTSLS